MNLIQVLSLPQLYYLLVINEISSNETSYCLGNINIRFSETERKYDG